MTVCAAALVLGGCGGGSTSGGGGVGPIASPSPPPPPPPAPPPPPPPPPPSPSSITYNDAEYARSAGTSGSNAIAAYNAGGTGKGVKIAVVDTGINASLPDFAGKVDPASRDIAGSRGITDTEGHGTATAATAAAARNGSGVMGVAFDATIISYNTADPNDCTDKDGCNHSSSNIATAIDFARQNGARVINVSLGGDESSFSVNQAVVRAAQAGIVVVMSAGNNGKEATGSSPENFALGAAKAGNVIIAGAMDSSRNLADFSNRAGNGASTYLTALGVKVVAPDETGALFYWSGTSFSAPVISGSVALLASAFPNLTGQQIISILFNSADDAGAPGTDAVFGRGILNIQRAFQPQGTLTLVDGKTPVDAGGSGGSTAMGNAGGKVSGMIVLDGFSRAYAMDLVQSLRRPREERPLAQALQPGLSTGTAGTKNVAVSISVSRRLTGQPQVGLAQLGLTYDDARTARLVSGMAVSQLSRKTAFAMGFSESGKSLEQRLTGQYQNAFLVARDPMSRMGFYADSAASVGARQKVGSVGVTVTGERGEVQQPGFDRSTAQPLYSIGAVNLDRRLGRAAFALGATRLDEKETILGARFSNMFGIGGGTSWFADASGSLELGRGWGAYAAYRRGSTAAPGGAGLAERGRLSTDAWTFDIAKLDAFRSGDKLAFRVMQPLRVRSGGFDLSVPVSYDYATLTAGYENRLFNLAPTGREVDFEASYGLGLLGDAGHLSANAFARRQPGHIAEADADLGAAIRFTLGF
jgi:hypothetical protein